MMKFSFLIFIILLLVVISFNQSIAQDKPLIVDLASNHIDVTVGFSGSTIEVFGDCRDKTNKIAIVVEGPERAITVWKKERILGTWVNRYFVKFNKIPVYYNYALSQDDIVKEYPEMAKKYRVGVAEMMATRSIKKSEGIENIDEFKKYLIDLHKRTETFPVENQKINFLNDHFFRVSFKIPPSVPTGDYKISSFLIKDGQTIEADTKMLRIKQVGLNAFILKASVEHGFLYGIFCIFFAAVCGWGASIIRVKI